MWNKCEECINKKTGLCQVCTDNPKAPRISYFQLYKPVCPRGFDDCVSDPAYIKYHHPEWYKELYGEKTPEEAIRDEEDGCWERFVNDPEMNYYCYDDEDK